MLQCRGSKELNHLWHWNDGLVVIARQMEMRMLLCLLVKCSSSPQFALFLGLAQ